jgi:hypothetical protein
MFYYYYNVLEEHVGHEYAVVCMLVKRVLLVRTTAGAGDEIRHNGSVESRIVGLSEIAMHSRIRPA